MSFIPSDRVVDVDGWPTLLAIPLKEYLNEQSAYIKLWAMCDLAELLLRVGAIIGVAELKHLHGELPNELRSELSDNIHRPTFGQWKNIAQRVLSFLPDGNQFGNDLSRIFETGSHGLFSLLDGPGNLKPNLENSLSLLRNKGLAHGAGINKQIASSWLNTWQMPFEELLKQISPVVTEWKLLCMFEGVLCQLSGANSRTSPVDSSDEAAEHARKFIESSDPESVVLMKNQSVRQLWPLVLFGSPRSGYEEENPVLDHSFQVYTRHDVDLEYAPIGSEAVARSVGNLSAHNEFLRIFTPSLSPPSYRVRGFEKDMRRESDAFVGRRKELEELYKQLDGRKQGVLWLTGVPGIGKSFLMSRIATLPFPARNPKCEGEQFDEEPSKLLVLAYRFKVGDDRCCRESFFRYALERLQEWPGLHDFQETADDDERTRQRKSLSLQLKEALLRVDFEGGWRVLVIVDGLDELLEQEQPQHSKSIASVAKFVREVPIACGQIPGVIWLCAGRPEVALVNAFHDPACELALPGDAGKITQNGLPPMDVSDVRKMLLFELSGPSRRRLLGRDIESPDSEQITNKFVSQVAAYSKGLPLYVRLVIGEAKSRGTLRHFDLTDLPKSLEEFYVRILERSSVGVLQQISTPIVALLAIASEALDIDTIVVLLRDRNVLSSNPPPLEAVRQKKIVSQAIAMISPLVRSLCTPENLQGYTLTHHTLREFIKDRRRCVQLHEPIETARIAIANSCTNPDLINTAAQRYVIRNVLFHNLPPGSWSRLFDMLTDIQYLETKSLRTSVFLVAADLRLAMKHWPRENSEHEAQLEVLRLIYESLNRSLHFLDELQGDYRQGLFQSLWNCLGPRVKNLPILAQSLLAKWMEKKNTSSAKGFWMQAFSPTTNPLGSPQIALYRRHQYQISSIDYTPDGMLLGTGCIDSIIIWESTSGKIRHQLKLERPNWYSDEHPLIRFDPEGTKLLACYQNQFYRLSTCTGEVLSYKELGEGFYVSGLYYTGNEPRAVVICDDRRVRIIAIEDDLRELTSVFGHETDTQNTSLAASGQYLATQSNGTVRIWNAEQGFLQSAFLVERRDTVFLSLSPNGSRVATTAAYNKRLQLWDSFKGELLLESPVFKAEITTLTFTRDGTHVITGDRSGSVRLWDAKTCEPLGEFSADRNEVTTILAATDLGKIAYGTKNGSVRILDITQIFAATPPENKGPKVIALSNHDCLNSVLCAFEDGSLETIDLNSGTATRRMIRDRRQTTEVRLSEDGRSAVHICTKDTVRWWGTSSKHSFKTIFWEDDLSCISHSPCEAVNCVGRYDGKLAVRWRTSVGPFSFTRRRVRIVHSLPVSAIAYSPLGDRLATASWEDIAIWEMKRGGKLTIIKRFHLKELHKEITSLAFSPDGKLLLSGHNDGGLILWDAEKGDILLSFAKCRGYRFRKQRDSTGLEELAGDFENSNLNIENILPHAINFVYTVSEKPNISDYFLTIASFFGKPFFIFSDASDNRERHHANTGQRVNYFYDGFSIVETRFMSDSRIIMARCENGMIRYFHTGFKNQIAVVAPNLGGDTLFASIAAQPMYAWIQEPLENIVTDHSFTRIIATTPTGDFRSFARRG